MYIVNHLQSTKSIKKWGFFVFLNSQYFSTYSDILAYVLSVFFYAFFFMIVILLYHSITVFFFHLS